MGLVDRVNRAFFRRLRAWLPRYVVETYAVRVTHPDGRDYRLLFADLTTATLHHRDVYAYDAIILALGFTNGETIELPKTIRTGNSWSMHLIAADALASLPTYGSFRRLAMVTERPCGICPSRNRPIAVVVVDRLSQNVFPNEFS